MFNQTTTERINLSYLIVALSITFGTLFLQSCATTGTYQDSTITRSESGSLIVEQESEDYLIRTGDEIEIAVWGYDEFNTIRTVTSRGLITIPLVGEMEARGLTKQEFTENLEEQLSEFIQDEITFSVSITNTEGDMVSVLGAVGSPNNYEIIENVSLFEILSRAGGTTEEADLRNVTVYRRNSNSSPAKIDLIPYLNGIENPSGIAPIVPGDIVYIPTEENVIRELSTFMRDTVLLFGMFRILN